jgi:hypothetical protein
MTEKVTDKEFIDMAERASAEIKMLRRMNADIAPKADAYDHLTAVIRLLPQRSQGFSEDLAWALDKRVSELTANIVEKP